jgi:hypothetical protein
MRCVLSTIEGEIAAIVPPTYHNIIGSILRPKAELILRKE